MQIGVRTPRLMMIGVALAVAFSFQGSRGIFETSEGRYAECAREMLESGNYLEPTLGYRPHWTKPPLTYWAIAAGMKLFGANEWGVRLFNAVAFTLTVLIVAWLGAALFDRGAGTLAGLIYASSPFPAVGACAVTTDTLLALFEVGAVFCYVRSMRAQPERQGARWLTAMWVLFGLGFLTKGPPALVALLPLAAWHAMHGKGKRLANIPGIALFLLTGLSWFIAVIIRHHELLSYFIGREVISRVASESVHNHAWYKGFVIYVPVLTLGAGLWLFPGLLAAWEEQLYLPRVLWSRARRNTAGAFLLIWLALPLMVFFLSSSRLELYVLPFYAPLALAVARGIRMDRPEAAPGRGVLATAAVCAVILIAAKAVAAHVPTDSDMRRLYRFCAAAGQEAECIVVNHPKLYGLQFYLRGKLTRVSPTGAEPWADGRISALLTEMAAASPARRRALICDSDYAPSLERLLKYRGVSFTARKNLEWAVLDVPR